MYDSGGGKSSNIKCMLMDVFVAHFFLPACVAFVAFLLAKNLRWRWKLFLVVAVFIAALLASLFLTHSSRTTVAQHWVVAGTVEDDTTREGIGQAIVSLEGITTPYMTEDNGNFRIALNGTLRNAERLRIHVRKAGYKDYDVTLTPPQDNLTVLLQRL